MKNVKLLQLSLVNFKGQNRTIPFNDEMTNIYGDNGTGKSANFDAFTWLLFGKDQFDRKDYQILTVDPVTTKIIDKVDAEVTAVISISDESVPGGETITLKRILHQNWERPRGAEKQVYKGNETLCYYNDIPLKVGEYQQRIAGIIDEAVFKLITNPAYFLFSKEMTWQKQRTHLLEMAGTISDTEIAGRKPEFKELLDRITGKSFEEHRKTLSTRKKKLKEDLAEIQPRIDQTNRLMPEYTDFTTIKAEIGSIDKEIAEIDAILSDRTKASEQHFAGIRKKQQEISILHGKQQDIVNKAKETAKDEAYRKNAERREMAQELNRVLTDVNTAERETREQEREMNNLETLIAGTTEKIIAKRGSWNTLNEKVYQGESGCLTCPVYNISCSDHEANRLYDNDGKAALQAFNEQKAKKLQDITSEGQVLSKTLEEYKSAVILKRNRLELTRTQVETCKSKAGTLQKTLEESPVAFAEEVIPESIEEWNTLQAKITALQADIDNKALPADDNTGQLDRKRELAAKRDALKLRYADKDKIEKYRKEVTGLESEGQNLSQQIADLEKDEFTMAEFSKIRIEECRHRVNSLFAIVDFQLYDKTIEGNESEACIPKNKKGVYISSTNTADKINAGLDIINALCRFHGITAPIFIDSGESINKPIPTDSQIIRLVVTTDKELKIN